MRDTFFEAVLISTMAKRYFEFRSASSAKFWEVSVRGKTMTVRYGKIGTTGQTKTKELADAAAAAKEAAKLVAAKEKKGYSLSAKKKAATKKAVTKKTGTKKKKRKTAQVMNTVSMSSVKALVPEGRSLPSLLAAFGTWAKRVPHGALGYFEGLAGERFEDGGVTEEANAAIGDVLTPFLMLGEGSQIALWYHGKGEPAVVRVDSEGQHENLAPSLERFLLNWSKRRSGVGDLDGEDEEDEGPPLAYERLAKWLQKRDVRARGKKTPSFDKWMSATIKANTPKTKKAKKTRRTVPTAKTTAALVECVGLLAVESPLAELLEELGVDLGGRRSERDFRSVHVAEHGYALRFEWPKGAESPHGNYMKGAKAALAKKSKARMLISVEFGGEGYESFDYFTTKTTVFKRYPAALPQGVKWTIRPATAAKKGFKPIYKGACSYSLTKKGLTTSLNFFDDEDYDEDEDPKNKGPNLGALEYVDVSCPYDA